MENTTPNFTIMTCFGPLDVTHVEATAFDTDDLNCARFNWSASNGATGCFDVHFCQGGGMDIITPHVSRTFVDVVISKFLNDLGNLTPEDETIIKHETRPTISKDTPVHPIEDGYYGEPAIVCPNCGEPLSNRGSLGDLKFFRCNICGQMLTLDDGPEYKLF